MIKKLIVLPAALLFFSGGQMFLSSCKDKQKQETSAPSTDTMTSAPTPPPAPVEINSDDTLKNDVADATKDFPTVKADVNDGVITLTGTIQRAKLRDLMTILNGLKPKKIENQLVIK